MAGAEAIPEEAQPAAANVAPTQGEMEASIAANTTQLSFHLLRDMGLPVSSASGPAKIIYTNEQGPAGHESTATTEFHIMPGDDESPSGAANVFHTISGKDPHDRSSFKSVTARVDLTRPGSGVEVEGGILDGDRLQQKTSDLYERLNTLSTYPATAGRPTVTYQPPQAPHS
ncbi:MAG TPA: hypothetical protein VII55_01500 [Candidatus Saccharimonadales bacterium]